MNQHVEMEIAAGAAKPGPCRAPLEDIANVPKALIRDGSVHEQGGENGDQDVWVECDGCSKWRKVPGGFEVDKDKSFFCYMLKDTTCATPEEEWGDDEEFLMDDEGGGGGGEEFADERQKEKKHKQQGVQGKRKVEGEEKRKRPLFEGAVTAGKPQRVEGSAGRGEEVAL